MSKALRIELYQQTACYKKPMAQKARETYPLPPYSTIKGFLHHVLNATTLIPMEISIQGTHAEKMVDLQTHRFYKKNTVTTMPTYVYLLKDVELLLHVRADEDTLHALYEALQSIEEAPSIGRREDLAVIRHVSFVELQKQQLENKHELRQDVYIPYEQIENDAPFMSTTGVSFRLNTVYAIIDDVRTWQTVRTQYFRKGEYIDLEWLQFDGEDTVFFHAVT
jgi:CRISPR-associated protein Cas5t